MKSNFKVGAALVAIATSAMHPACAHAQEAGANGTGSDAQARPAYDSDIIVTAQRRGQSILKVPIAITAVTGEALAAQGITDTTRLTSVVPNLQINSAYGKTQPNFSIRGIGVGNEFNANQASPVGVYLDDAYISSRTSHGAQLFDLERVEVLRGPQGTLFGRNTTGGAVNIISRQPALSGASGFAEAGYGNFNAVHLGGALEVTPVEDKVGLRVSAVFDRWDPMMTNVLDNGVRDPNGGKTYAGRVMLRLKPSEKIDILLKAYGSKDDLGQSPLGSVGTAADGSNPITGYTRERPISQAGPLGFYEAEINTPGYRRNNAWGFLGKINYEISDMFTLSSLTSYDGGGYRLRHDADSSPFDVLDYRPGSDTRAFNQEVKGQITTDDLTLIFGGYYGWDRTDTQNTFDLLFLFKPLPAITQGGFGVEQDYRQVRTSRALFAQMDYKFDEHWALTAGFRYTWDKARFEDALAFFTDYDRTPLLYTVTDPANPGQPAPTLKGSSSAPTGRLALTYTTDGGQLIFASFNHGYRSGTFSGGAYISNSQLSYVKPETVNAFELGSKGRLFDGALTYNVAAFYNKYSNQQTVEVVGIAGFLRNAGKSTIYGFEAELTGRISPDLTLRGSLGLLHARYDELLLGRDDFNPVASPGVDLTGSKLPFAPDVTAQAGFDWNFAKAGGGEFTFSPTVSYTSRVWFSPFNATPLGPTDLYSNERLQQGAMALVDATLSYANGPFSARLWVKNLSKKQYFSYGLNVSSLGLDLLSVADPRTFGASVRFEF